MAARGAAYPLSGHDSMLLYAYGQHRRHERP